jgi:hypothetical protein
MAKGRAWLCGVPAALIVADVCLTLRGQPAAYWAGHYERAVELNPPACWALRQHPLLFAAGGLLWLVATSALVLFLPRRLARGTALALVLGHTAGAASWLARDGGAGWGLAVLLFALAYLLLDWSWRQEAAALARGRSVNVTGRHPEHVRDSLAQRALAQQPRPVVGVPQAVDQGDGQGR